MKFNLWRKGQEDGEVEVESVDVEFPQFPQFPHCDSLILHSPGLCEYCDRHPDWQEYRKRAGIAFSDYDAATVAEFHLVPCPSTFRRSAETRDRWHGNTVRGY